MIPEYKLYHGAVLAELVDRCGSAVSIRAYQESGRALNYILSDVVGLQVKHATQRLHPWQFTFAKPHLDALFNLKVQLKYVFVVLVCHTDGMVCMNLDDALSNFGTDFGSQAWLRADRRKGEWYRLYGPQGEFPTRYPAGIDRLVEVVGQGVAM
jgi:hypothetical protein